MVWLEEHWVQTHLDGAGSTLCQQMAEILLATPPGCGADRSQWVFRRLLELADEREAELGNAPELEEAAHRLLSAADPFARAAGSTLLRNFPTVSAIDAQAGLALDNHEDWTVRETAIESLGCRRLGARAAASRWTEQACQRADTALCDVLRLPGRHAFRRLPQSLAACRSTAVWDLVADEVTTVSQAIQGFGSGALAEALRRKFDELPGIVQVRAISLVADLEGPAALEWLNRLSESAPGRAVREAATQELLLVTAIDLETATSRLVGSPFPDICQQLTRWHAKSGAARVANRPRRGALGGRGDNPVLDARRTALVSATLGETELRSLARSGAGALLQLAYLARLSDAMLYESLGELLLHGGDPELLLQALPLRHEGLGCFRALVPEFCRALASRGEFTKLEAFAASEGELGLAVWELARRARPFRALALAQGVQRWDVDAVAGRGLGLFLAGRPDLAGAWLRQAPRVTEVRSETDADERPRQTDDPRRRALALGDAASLLSLVTGAPAHAEPDRVDPRLLAEEQERLEPGLRGRSVVLLGSARQDPELRRQLMTEGSRIVEGAFAGADFFITGRGAQTKDVARLLRHGVRPYPMDSFNGTPRQPEAVQATNYNPNSTTNEP